MKKKIYQVVLGLLLMAGAFFPPVQARAQETTPTGQPTQTQDSAQQSAAKFIKDLGNRGIDIVADKKLPQDQRDQQYYQLLDEAFDIPAIGKFVIGRAWSRATPEQQNEYLRLFRALVIKIYGNRLSLYNGEGFDVKGARQESDNDFVVTSQITHGSGNPPTLVDWRVRGENGNFKVVDVIVEGVSQSITQRQEYASIIQRDGGKIDGLLDLMRKRVEAPDQPQTL